MTSSEDTTTRATSLLFETRAGDASAEAELGDLLYTELRKLARKLMSSERGDHTLQATALVNEAWIRMIRQEQASFEDRGHFLRMAARAMRFVLVDHARARGSQKRGGDKLRTPLDTDLHWYRDRGQEMLEFDDALTALETVDPELARIVELRFFGGCTVAETATMLGSTESRVEKAWRVARLWLARRLTADGG